MLKHMVFDLKPYSVNVKVHNLSDLIKKLSRPNWRGYKNLIMDAAQCTLDGLTFLHSCGVAHRDIKLSNILVGKNKFNNASNLVVKLCDFGESWGNIIQATNCKRSYSTNVFKGICWKMLPVFCVLQNHVSIPTKLRLFENHEFDTRKMFSKFYMHFSLNLVLPKLIFFRTKSFVV